MLNIFRRVVERDFSLLQKINWDNFKRLFFLQGGCLSQYEYDSVASNLIDSGDLTNVFFYSVFVFSFNYLENNCC
jgi:hypothetical protein